MKIREIKIRNVVSKSGLNTDFVINPYTGCMHGCVYCYARFMKKYTSHKEPWGKFVDVKVNAAETIPPGWKYSGKTILISSVTDAYQPVERRYRLMRKILKRLQQHQPDLGILTKSDMVLRDIDLLKKFRKIEVGVSLSLLDDGVRKEVEPLACSVERRINAVKELKKSGLKTFIFISPILPGLSDWRGIVEKTKDFADEFWFENLNVRGLNWSHIKKWLEEKHPELLGKYEGIYFGKSDYWNRVEKEIKSYGKGNKLNFKIYFHHRRQKRFITRPPLY
jgi:DNA repair photolyase